MKSCLSNKKLLLYYLTFIIVIFVSIVFIHLCARIERVGYITDFNKIFDNYYYCKMSYYNNIFFRHSDIFGVYPYSKDNSIVFDDTTSDTGSPFLTVYVDKDLESTDKVDVFYKLKLKKQVIIFLLLFIILLPILYLYIVPNIINYYLYYIGFFILNILLYLILNLFIMPNSSMLKLNIHYADILLSYIFIMLAFNFLNRNIFLTLLFEAFNTFSFFVIEPISLTTINTIVFFTDMPTLYPTFIKLLSTKLKVITIIVTIVYIILSILFTILIILNILKLKKLNIIILFFYLGLFIYIVFFRNTHVGISSLDFVKQANKNGIIDTINYKINYNRVSNVKYSKSDVYEAINILKDMEKDRDYSNLLLKSSIGTKRDIFIIFLESYYDFSHFIDLFDKDPFSYEYRKWANSSSRITPNTSGGSLYARLSCLTASSPLYQKKQLSNVDYTLVDLLNKNEYYTIAVEEAVSTYGLDNFLPSIGFKQVVFGIGLNNLYSFITNNLYSLKKPLFLYSFTLLGHTETYITNDIRVEEHNKRLFAMINNNDINSFKVIIENAVLSSLEALKIRDYILKISPNALIIFKHDHLHPYIKGIIERSTIPDDIKNSFLIDNSPNPLLVWDGTNGAYRFDNVIVPENLPMFIAINAGVSNYQSSIISLLYKYVIDNEISTYHNYYSIDISNNFSIINNPNRLVEKYEKAQNILSQDLFKGRKYYFDYIKE